MSSVTPTLITSGVGVYSDAANIVWKIRNFPSIQQDANLVNKQRFDFETSGTSSYHCQWLIGLEHGGYDSKIQMFFKLVRLNGPENSVSINVTVELKKSDGSTHWSKQSAATLQQDRQMSMGNILAFNKPEETWNTLVDARNALTFKINMKILLTTTPLREAYEGGINCTKRLTESFKKLLVKKSQSNYAALLTDQLTHDVKIVCGNGKEFFGHMLILGAQCPVFKSMLSSKNNFSEVKNGVIEITDISGKTMEILLKYFYTGDVSPEWSDPDTILEFTYAAGKYQLTEVLKMLDGLIGRGDDSTCNMSLLSLVTKLELKNAEAQLVQRIVKRTRAAKNSADLFEIYGNTREDEENENTLSNE